MLSGARAPVPTSVRVGTPEQGDGSGDSNGQGTCASSLWYPIKWTAQLQVKTSLGNGDMNKERLNSGGK